MRITGLQGIDLNGKCGSCKFYKPLIKDWYGIMTMFARGSCSIVKRYKQRTEQCKKYIEMEVAK